MWYGTTSLILKAKEYEKLAQDKAKEANREAIGW